jgi:ABC-type branched-subunit amino acid transport system substrate-binding protein
VTDGTNGVFPDVSDQIHTIVEQNKRTEAQHSSQPTRPLLTLVYLGVLDEPYNDPKSLTTEREGLKGVAVAQEWQLNAQDGTQPLIRVLIANGGQRMSSGPDVAQTIIAMAKKDPSIVGVVGLSNSYQDTVNTVNALTEAEIPSVGATLSADALADDSLMYYQIAPQNRREAEVVAKYAATTWPPSTTPVRIYYSADPHDLYTNSLASDALASFSTAGFHRC